MKHFTSKLALLHDDDAVASRIGALAVEAELSVDRVPSLAALEERLNDPALAAVVVDLVGPNSGGFELLERLAEAASSPRVIVVTTLDAKTVESARRLASTKGLKISIFRKDALDSSEMKTCLAGLAVKEKRFDAEALEQAIERELFSVEYQPKIPMEGSATAEFGVEALCRLEHPEFGTIRPDAFIGMAEKEGLIARLTDAVVRKAFRDWQAWRSQGLKVRLALNVSPELLRSTEWCEQFLRTCAEFEMDPNHITLEITETSQVTSHASALDILTRLRLKGFTLSIDDFGTGFSSLATLYKLPFGELKIDKSFTIDLKSSNEARALIESTIGLAQKLGITVCAEGVESKAVFRELSQMGCGHAQGYFISKSIPPEKIPEFFEAWTRTVQPAIEAATMPGDLPKIAIIQWLLNDLVKEAPDDDRTVIFSEADAKAFEASALEDSTLDLAKKIPSLVLQRQVPAAIAQCHAVSDRLKKKPGRNWQAKIQELQRLLEFELLCKDDLELEYARGVTRLMQRNSALVGRSSQSKRVDVPIGCRWLSRGEKNLRVFLEKGNWFVEDLGAANGLHLGRDRLARGRPYAIPVGETLLEIGKQPGAPAPVGFRFRRPRLTPTALEMRLVANPDMFSGDGAVEWPLWQDDVKLRWLFFQDRLTVGRSPDCALVLEDCTADVAAEIYFADGYWIAPSSGAEISISAIPVRHAIPVPTGHSVSIAGSTVSVHLITDASETAKSSPASRAAAG